MAQTTYNTYMTEGQEGLITDLKPATVISRVAEGAVGFGRALVAGTDAAEQVKIPAAAGSVFRGISVGTWALERNTATNAVYLDETTVSILRRGEIWVTVKDAVTIDSPVYYYISGDNAGMFTSVNSSITERLPNAVFTSAADGDALATLEVSLPFATPIPGELAIMQIAAGQDDTVTADAHEVAVTGMLATDIVLVNNVALTNAAYITAITAASGKFTVSWNTTPGASTINYLVLRV